MNKKNYKVVSKRLTCLTDRDLTNLKRVVAGYLKTQAFITNSILRKITSATYDQAVLFYKAMVKQKVLKKIGINGGTRYVINAQDKNYEHYV